MTARHWTRPVLAGRRGLAGRSVLLAVVVAVALGGCASDGPDAGGPTPEDVATEEDADAGATTEDDDGESDAAEDDADAQASGGGEPMGCLAVMGSVAGITSGHAMANNETFDQDPGPRYQEAIDQLDRYVADAPEGLAATYRDVSDQLRPVHVRLQQGEQVDVEAEVDEATIETAYDAIEAWIDANC